ncbi:hypothetical protein CEXT_519371 [Caerostris extrusa]|uniref:Uncharacterized protein n=1 Tax=Caerostris extrusa TaxID=172846 RepID=A0AAV4VYQ7_CAEEX|nr:hypothetical protein CEXT_519371 [Caerostris extrusa]
MSVFCAQSKDNFRFPRAIFLAGPLGLHDGVWLHDMVISGPRWHWQYRRHNVPNEDGSTLAERAPIRPSTFRLSAVHDPKGSYTEYDPHEQFFATTKEATCKTRMACDQILSSSITPDVAPHPNIVDTIHQTCQKSVQTI